MEQLLPQEQERLAELEKVIRSADLTYIVKGKALTEINASRLYRQEFPSFNAYCEAKWDMDKATAHRFIHAAAVAEHLTATGFEEIPTNESQARKLARFLDDLDKLDTVWRDVLDRNERITAKLIAEVAEDLYPTEERDDPADDGEGNDQNAADSSPPPYGGEPHGSPRRRYTFEIATKAAPDAIVELRRGLELPPDPGDAEGTAVLEGQTIDYFALFSACAAWIEDHQPVNFGLTFKRPEGDE